MTNPHRVLYAGVTNSLSKRVAEHRSFQHGFTAKYKLFELVYYERFAFVHDAIAREKQIKSWGRARKIELIESRNPAWRDVYGEWPW